MAALSRLTELLSTERGLKEAATGALRALGEPLGFEAGALWGGVEDEPATLRLLATWTAQPGRLAAYEVQGPMRQLERGRGVAGWAWQSRLPAVLGDEPTETTGVEAQVRTADRLDGWLAIPLTYGDAVHGLIELVRQAPVSADEELRRGALVVGRLLGDFAGREDTLNALQRTKRALADLTDHAPLGINLLDEGGRVLRTNRAQLSMLGYGRSEFVGAPWADFMEASEARALWDKLHASRSSDAVLTVPARLRCRDGSWRSVELLVNAGWSEAGELERVRVLTRDVTDLVHTGAALAETEGRYRRLLDSVIDYSLHTLDPGGLITSWNKGGERMFGFVESEVVGRPCEMLFAPEAGRERLPQRMLQLAMDEGRFEFECLRRRKDGSSFAAAVNFTCLRDAQGAVTEISVLTQDITPRRRLEALRRRSADLEQANRGVVETARRSADLMQHVVHTLERPLEALHAAVANAQGRAGSGVSLEAAELLEAADQLARAVRALNSTSTGMAEQLGVAASPVDLVRVASEARDLLREQAAERRLRLEIDVDPSLEDVTVDASVLAQVIYNLLSHGVWASRERGRVTMRALPEGAEDFRLEVEDTGIGLTADEAQALFNVPEGAEIEEGRSLGLLATKRIVEEQGGRVGIHSAPGRGSVVFAVLPRAPRERQARQEEFTTSRTLRQVLVVSENLATRAGLCWTLGRTSQEVISADGPDEALRIARERRCEVVAFDLLMEGMPPTDFVERLRAEGSSREVPCLIAALGAPGIGVAGIVATDLLPRPVPADRLFAALERARVARGRERPVLVLDSDVSTCKSICRTLDILDYAAVPEIDAHGALRACAESPPAAILLSPFIQGMDVFSFLHHLRGSGRTKDVPLLLLVPRTWTEGQLDVLRESAEDAAREGHWHRGLALEGIGQSRPESDPHTGLRALPP